MYQIQNVSTKKFYTCSKEEYEKFYKGKLNWKLISTDYQEGKNQVITNNVSFSYGKEKDNVVTSNKPKEKTNTKKQTQNEKS